VARHEVHQHGKPALVRGADEGVVVGQGPQPGIDVRVVRDVVAEIGERRGIDRREPERVHAEVREVLEALLDPPEIADAVAVRILERPWVDLVDDRVPPGHGPIFTGGPASYRL
jgi:hypothetical protein